MISLIAYAFCGQLTLLQDGVEAAEPWLELAGEQEELVGPMTSFEVPAVTRAWMLLAKGDEASVARGHVTPYSSLTVRRSHSQYAQDDPGTGFTGLGLAICKAVTSRRSTHWNAHLSWLVPVNSSAPLPISQSLFRLLQKLRHAQKEFNKQSTRRTRT